MRARTSRPFLSLALASLATTTLLAAPSTHGDGIAKSEDRESLFFLRELRQESQMISNGESAKTDVEVSPSQSLLEEASQGLGLGGGASASPAYDQDIGNGPGAQSGGFFRYLRTGLDQARGQSYRGGWETLRDYTRRALELAGGDIPSALRVALQSGLQASDKVDTYESAFEILSTCVKMTIQDPSRFEGDRSEAFRAGLRMGRQASYEKSYKHAYEIMNIFADNLQRDSENTSEELEMIGLRAVDDFADKDDSYQAAWTALETGFKRIEGGIRNLGHYFELCYALGEKQSNVEKRYKVVVEMVQPVQDRKDFYPNAYTHMALKSALKMAKAVDTYDSANRVLGRTVGRLRQAVRNPGQYFSLALEASRLANSKHTYESLILFAENALSARFLNQFDADSLRMAVNRAKQDRSYDSAIRTLEIAFRGFSQA